MIVTPVLLFHVAAATICRWQLQDQQCHKALAEHQLAMAEYICAFKQGLFCCCGSCKSQNLPLHWLQA